MEAIYKTDKQFLYIKAKEKNRYFTHTKMGRKEKHRIAINLTPGIALHN